MSNELQEQQDQYIRSVAGTGKSPAEQISDAKALHEEICRGQPVAAASGHRDHEFVNQSGDEKDQKGRDRRPKEAPHRPERRSMPPAKPRFRPAGSNSAQSPQLSARIAAPIFAAESSPEAFSTTTTRALGNPASSGPSVRRQSIASPADR